MTADNVAKATPIERWAYFLLNADKLTREEIRRIFPDEEFGEAAEVLEMISRSPEEHHVYDMRLKFLRDEATRLAATQRDIAAARDEGRVEGFREGEARGEARGEAKGVQKGTLLGRIAVLQELLGIAKSTADEFAGLDENQLGELAERLQTQLRNRGPAI